MGMNLAKANFFIFSSVCCVVSLTHSDDSSHICGCKLCNICDDDTDLHLKYFHELQNEKFYHKRHRVNVLLPDEF